MKTSVKFVNPMFTIELSARELAIIIASIRNAHTPSVGVEVLELYPDIEATNVLDFSANMAEELKHVLTSGLAKDSV
ncbi:MAG: hypothetical protein ACXAD7_28135 [Candidatus Kariarchaeaceae archaeon]